MKRYKQAAAWLLTLACLMLWILPVSAAPSATITVGTAAAAPGDTVTVTLSVSQVTEIGAVGIYLKYDTAVLECLSAEAVGIMNNMDTNTANTKPANRQGEVWLTGMCLAGISGEGELMTMTFKVKDDAPEGLSTIGFVDDKPNQLILLDTSLVTATNVTGGVAVTSKAATPDTTTPTTAATTAQAVTTAQGATPGTTTAQGGVTTPTTNAPITRPGGETVTVSQVTVVGADGTVVTTPQGDPVMMQSTAVMVDKVSAMPGDRVTVDVALTAVSNVTVMGIDVSYDAQALSFVGGEMIGFAAAEMNAANVMGDQEGVIVISGTDPIGVSGEGAVARLTFEVKRSVKAGEYRLELSPAPIFMTKDAMQVPVVTYAGAVQVEADGASGGWVLAVVGAVAAAGALATVLVILSRRKKAATPPEQ